MITVSPSRAFAVLSNSNSCLQIYWRLKWIQNKHLLYMLFHAGQANINTVRNKVESACKRRGISSLVYWSVGMFNDHGHWTLFFPISYHILQIAKKRNFFKNPIQTGSTEQNSVSDCCGNSVYFLFLVFTISVYCSLSSEATVIKGSNVTPLVVKLLLMQQLIVFISFLIPVVMLSHLLYLFSAQFRFVILGFTDKCDIRIFI